MGPVGLLRLRLSHILSLLKIKSDLNEKIIYHDINLCDCLFTYCLILSIMFSKPR